MQMEKLIQEADSREKILDAKIEDQGDKLRLGMVSLQSAIGEGESWGDNINSCQSVNNALLYHRQTSEWRH